MSIASRLMRLFGALALILGGVAVTASPASAGEVSVISPSSIQFAGNSSLQVGSNARIDYSFDTSALATQPSPGDTFTLELPPEFAAAPGTTAWPLFHPDGTEIAVCDFVVAENSIVCTFSDSILDESGAPRYTSLTGNVWFLARAVDQTSATTVDFGTSGGTVTVDLPGPGGIAPTTYSYPQEIMKDGYFPTSSADRTEIRWSISVPGDQIDTTLAIVVEDQLGPGQTITTAPELRELTDPANNGWTTISSGWDVTVAPDSTGFTMNIAPDTLGPDELYRVVYTSTTDNANIGQTYTNVAYINGEQENKSLTRGSLGGGSADGPGFGSVAVLKQPLAGEAASSVPAETEFTALASYTLGGELTETEVTMTAGGAPGLLSALPAGTEVTLTEITFPDVDGVSWGQPVFANPAGASTVTIASDGLSATLTIGDQTETYVELTNTADASITYEPSIEIVKTDAAGNDADSAESSVDLTAADGAAELVFTITNNGDEPLENVVVTDEVTAGSGSVSGLTCDFSALGGPASGTEWAEGPFNPEDSFTCTAQLTGVVAGDAHTDVAAVAGTGIYSGVPVDDDNPYNAHVQEAPTAPPADNVPPVDDDDAPLLASTGAAVFGLGGTALVLLVVGTIALIAARRRNGDAPVARG
ncbi:MAG: collagen binding domain-containing protein [Cumulibacter sp.]